MLILSRIGLYLFIYSRLLFASLLVPMKPAQLTFPSTVFLILPGFGNDHRDYRDIDDEHNLLENLSKRGLTVDILEINRFQWLTLAKGVFSKAWYSYECTPDNLFSFYFDALTRKIENIKSKSNNSSIVFICHSAAGWLARGYLGETSKESVAGLVSLGTPHLPPRDIRADMTRGAWTHVHRKYPGSYHRDKIFYVTVAGLAGRAVPGLLDSDPASFAYKSYATVRGGEPCLVSDDDLIGDGVTPLSSAHLDGALQLSIDAWHGVRAPEGNMWFGSDGVVDQWLDPTLSLLSSQQQQRDQLQNRLGRPLT